MIIAVKCVSVSVAVPMDILLFIPLSPTSGKLRSRLPSSMLLSPIARATNNVACGVNLTNLRAFACWQSVRTSSHLNLHHLSLLSRPCLRNVRRHSGNGKFEGGVFAEGVISM